MADPTPNVLTLRTSLTTNPVVSINGKTYPFRARLMRDLVEIIRFDQLNAQIDKAISEVPSQGPTEEQVKAIRGMLDDFCRRVVDAPDEFFAELDDLDRFDIRSFFIALHRPSQPAAGAETPGSTAPADSPGSTPVPATPGIG